MRVLVCGSRDFDDYQFLTESLDALLLKYPVKEIIHGAAKGADTIAGIWAVARDIPVTEYPADWNTHGRAAGPIRNRQMLDEGKPDLVVAFINKPLAESRGTANMLKIAQEAGVRTFVEGKIR